MQFVSATPVSNYSMQAIKSDNYRALIGESACFMFCSGVRVFKVFSEYPGISENYFLKNVISLKPKI